jgi:hypothetical protein
MSIISVLVIYWILKNIFGCGLTMIALNPIINTKLKEEGLPDLSYRISTDYGRVQVAKSLMSTGKSDGYRIKSIRCHKGCIQEQ